MQQQIEVLWAPRVAVDGTDGVEIFTGTARASRQDAITAAENIADKIGDKVLWFSVIRSETKAQKAGN